MVVSKEKRANLGYPRKWCIIDVRNAFNTARWDYIVRSLEQKNMSVQLVNVIKSYLSNRTLLYGKNETRGMWMTVPQGSVLGPTLWNTMYDEICNITMPGETELICFTDDVAIVGEDVDLCELIHKMNIARDQVGSWLHSRGLAMAPGKTETTLLKFGTRNKEYELSYRRVEIKSSSSVKYLGVVLDTSMSFGTNIRSIASKVERVVTALCRSMPNIGGPGDGKRRTLWYVAQSVMLYGAPVWADAIRVTT